jgi:hypothetical protein
MHKGWKKIVDFLGWGCRRAMREREGVGLRKKEIMLKCCSVVVWGVNVIDITLAYTSDNGTLFHVMKIFIITNNNL